ncbi:beta-mannosidase [Radicibacter daui]|uniref:beta-mannosidase n=1 Tax=Radicibacter daui TaxID=3064829 RepID=UPI004046DB6F
MDPAFLAPPRTDTGFRSFDLGGSWRASAPEKGISLPVSLPGDLHSALMAAGHIPDPYFGRNELEIQWVAHTSWVFERSFELPSADAGALWTLSFETVDCLATLTLNGKPVGEMQNQFRRYRFEVGHLLVPGTNYLRLEFTPAPEEANRRAAAFPFEVPYAAMNMYPVRLNFLRKVQCHAGWDWNLCLMPLGVYGAITLTRSPLARIEHVETRQRHDAGGSITVTALVELHAARDGEAHLGISLEDEGISRPVTLRAGINHLSHSFTLDRPRLWWPAGQGDQPLYDLTVTLDGERVTRRLGLRTMALVTEKDEVGETMKLRVNGRDVFAKGANWIPGDALPGRITPENLLPLLRSAVDANMNMLRVWGGGQFEPDWFYEACDELGLMIWHDFMFSCMHYPADRAFLQEVRAEAEYQVRRLAHHPSIALWCGDNEVVGALGWYEATRKNRDRYLVLYDRLNRTLEEVVEDHDPERRFWPSSPSLGPLNFDDGWHGDTSGDLHFWEVWHSAKPFEFYRTIKPRFCSEFGFQSFPSMPVIESFAAPEERNISSPVMEIHQRNQGGNARIVETMTRYFRFPKDFEALVYLSQIQQALAIGTAVDYWRSLKPRCMGTLYWQLNDTWPVASWSSLNYGGSWKLLHYAARHFYAPVRVVAIPDDNDGARVHLVAVSDDPAPVTLTVRLRFVSLAGDIHDEAPLEVSVPPGRSTPVATVPLSALGKESFLAISWHSADGRHAGRNDYFPRPYKDYVLPRPEITAEWHRTAGGRLFLTLSSPEPAFYVTAETRAAGRFSDNGVTLLPGEPLALEWLPADAGMDPKDDLVIRHLALTS